MWLVAGDNFLIKIVDVEMLQNFLTFKWLKVLFWYMFVKCVKDACLVDNWFPQEESKSAW